MANVGMSYCPTTCFPLCDHCQSLRLTISLRAKDEAGPEIAECPLPRSLALYAASGDGVAMAFDEANQIFQTDPAAGYPAVSLWCDTQDGDPANGRPLIRVQPQTGGWRDYFPGWESTENDGSMTLKATYNADCDMIFRFQCVNDHA